jgi:hypothetical protein
MPSEEPTERGTRLVKFINTNIPLKGMVRQFKWNIIKRIAMKQGA